jgi:predicted component of type VI protein secretion system
MNKEKLLAMLLSLCFMSGCAVAFRASHSSGEVELDLKTSPEVTDSPCVPVIQSENA